MNKNGHDQIENDLRDGMTYMYVAKKYNIDADKVKIWWKRKRASKKMDDLIDHLKDGLELDEDCEKTICESKVNTEEKC